MKKKMTSEQRLRRQLRISRESVALLQRALEDEKGRGVGQVIAIQQERERANIYVRANDALRGKLEDANNHRELLANLCRILMTSTAELSKMTIPLFVGPIERTDRGAQGAQTTTPKPPEPEF